MLCGNNEYSKYCKIIHNNNETGFLGENLGDAILTEKIKFPLRNIGNFSLKKMKKIPF